ncbi:MAG: alpha/beta hydrolase [Deltaproteobacteria bacterium]|nr:alpha/beta hydrolase [Deltaproteobacteria bacterium]
MKLDYVTARGLRFAYLAAGTGPLVLLVHGFPDTAYTWDATLPAVAAAGYRAVAPFTRGYHPTAIPADGAYDVATLGGDLLALIEALGADRAIVVGHDWGASAAYSAAAIAPERVRLLVPVAIPHPGGITPTPRLVWLLRHLIAFKRASGPARLRANDFALVDELYARWSPAWKDIPRSETARVKAAFAEPGVVEAALGYYRAQPFRPPPSHRTRIEVPTVAFAGEDDAISPRLYEKARHMFGKSYEVVQVPGGHFMHREHPEAFIPELVSVLRDNAPPA